MIRRIILNIVNFFGYTITRIPTIDLKIEKGDYLWLQNMNINTIIDVGANNGEFAQKINKILPEVEIHSFEPLKECIEELKENLVGIKKIKFYNYALGEKDEEKIFYHNQFAPSSSFLEMKDLHKNAFPYTSTVFEEKVSVKKLDNFINELIKSKEILLKIDVQGYELNVLKGGYKFLNEVKIIILEVSFHELYKDQPLFNDIYTYLVEKGFNYYGNFEQLIDPHNGQILQADAIFIKQ
ncbi:MAG: FkbM family methyltransferase [Ignavibacteriae bacterium]|nr:FkbM family methyltransferase [Ignavibacteriota bacterium]